MILTPMSTSSVWPIPTPETRVKKIGNSFLPLPLLTLSFPFLGGLLPYISRDMKNGKSRVNLKSELSAPCGTFRRFTIIMAGLPNG